MAGISGPKTDVYLHPAIAAVIAYLGVYYLKDVAQLEFLQKTVGNPLLYGVLIAAAVGVIYGLFLQKYVKDVV